MRTNVPKLSVFSGEAAKGEVLFDQWSYEPKTLRKSYSDLTLREGIQHSLRGGAADVVGNMGPNVPLDLILKKFTIIYENVKSYATRIEGLLSQIRDKFPHKLSLQEE